MATWTQLQALIGTASGSNPYTKAYGSNVTAGSFLVAVVSWANNTGSISTFGDNLNGSNSWKPAGSLIQGAGRSIGVYYLNGSAPGALTVSAQLSATQTVFFALYEFGGPGAVVDVFGSNFTSTATTSPTTNSITPTNPNDLVIAGLKMGGSGNTVSAGESGWTFQTNGNAASEYIQPGSLASLAGTFTSTSAQYAAVIVAFAPITTAQETSRSSGVASEAQDAGTISETETSGASASESEAVNLGSVSSVETSEASASGTADTLDLGRVSASETSQATASPINPMSGGSIPIISDMPNSNTLANPAALTTEFVAMVSYRTNWESVQPSQPTSGVPNNNPNDATAGWNWAFLDSAVAQAAAYGKKAWIRINVQGSSSPDWIQSLAQQYIAVSGKSYNVWWDYYYQSYLTALIQAVGSRYASNPVVTVFTCNIASDNVGDWTVPNVAPSSSGTGAGNWQLSAGFTFPAYGQSVTVTPIANQQVHNGQLVLITGFGWVQVTGFSGTSSNPSSVTLLNLGITGNANSGSVPSTAIMFVSDVANLTGPVYRYTTAKFVTAITDILSVSNAAFPNQVIDQEVGRSGTLDPFPGSIPGAVLSPVQQTIGPAAGTNPYTLAYNSNVRAGNSLFAVIAWSNNAGSVTSFTDTLNAAQWTPGPLIQDNNRTLAVFIYNDTLGGACTVEATLNATEGGVQMALFELPGANVAVDISGVANGSSVTSVTTPYISPSFPNELVIAALFGGTGITGELGWSGFQTHGSFATQYIEPGSTSPIDSTFAQASAGYVTIIIAFSGTSAAYGSTFAYNAATRMAQWGYANLPAGSFAIEKDIFDAQTVIPSVALSDEDGSSFFLVAQTFPGSSNTSGTEGAIPPNSLLYGQFNWPCFDATGLYNPTTTASANGPYAANGGIPYTNPAPVFQETVVVAAQYLGGRVLSGVLETYELDILNLQDTIDALYYTLGSGLEVSGADGNASPAIDAGTVATQEESAGSGLAGTAVDAGHVSAGEVSRAGAVTGGDPGPVQAQERSGATAVGSIVRDTGHVTAATEISGAKAIVGVAKPAGPTIINGRIIAKVVKTISGDTWDILSKRYYKTERFANVLMGCNPQLCSPTFYAIFPANLSVNIPFIQIPPPNASQLPWSQLYQYS